MQIKTEDIYSLNPSSIRSNLLFCVSCLPLPNINFTAVPRTQIWLYSPEFTLYMKTVAFPEMLYGFWLSFLKDSKKRMCCNLLTLCCQVFYFSSLEILSHWASLLHSLCCTFPQNAFFPWAKLPARRVSLSFYSGLAQLDTFLNWGQGQKAECSIRAKFLCFWALLSSLISDSSWHLFTVVGTAPNGGHLWTADLILWIVGYKLGNSTGWRGGFWAECLIRA